MNRSDLKAKNVWYFDKADAYRARLFRGGKWVLDQYFKDFKDAVAAVEQAKRVYGPRSTRKVKRLPPGPRGYATRPLFLDLRYLNLVDLEDVVDGNDPGQYNDREFIEHFIQERVPMEVC